MNRKATVLVFVAALFIWGGHACAQNLKRLDSLHQQLRRVNNGDRFNLLNTIGFEYRYSYPDSTLFYCGQAYQLGLDLKINAGLARPLSFMGLASNNKGDYKHALDFHYRSIEVATAQNDTIQLAHAYNNIGRMFFDEGDLVRAYDNLSRSKTLFEETGDLSGLAYVYRSLAHLYKTQKDYTHSLEMLARVLELRKKLGNQRDVVSAYLEQAALDQTMNNPAAALKKFAMADSVGRSIDDPVTHGEIDIGIAESLLREGKTEDAYSRAIKVLRLISPTTNIKLFLRSSIVCATCDIRRGLDRQAIERLVHVTTDWKNPTTISFQRDACLLLAQLYEKQNQKNLAADYQTKYKILNSQLENQDLARQVQQLQFSLDIEKKEKENELLRAREQKDQAVIGQQRRGNILLIFVVISTSALAVIYQRFNRRRKLANKTLMIQNRQIFSQQNEIANQNQALLLRNNELSKLNHEKDTLMHIVAHDLKSPLNQILGLSDLIQRETKQGTLPIDYVPMLKKSARAGLDMISDLLDVETLNDAASAPHYASCRPFEILNEIADRLRVSANAKSITLHTQSSNNVAVTDVGYLARIIDNLISNAIKFSDPHTAVHAAVDIKGQTLTISVRDQGPGFSPEDQGLLFQKFRKLSARPTQGESSNGLGLAIVKILVDRLKGEINLSPVEPHGAAFTIYLPIPDTAEPAMPA